MLFIEKREHFFRPLTGKYRGQIVDCLGAFYERLYGALADYSQSFTRDQVLEIFEETIARSPILDADDSDEYTSGSRTQREQANWILHQLVDHGWLERNIDEATLHATYAFSRHGRMFTGPMVDSAGRHFRTRHRNTRNTRNALKSFFDKGEIYDLLDAYEYSERIISDFSDIIAELDERRRQLVKEVESQQVVQRASDEFFDFMEKRFMPDLSIRLSADSVEKYRDEISDLIASIKRKRKEFKTQAERELRRSAPELVSDPTRSVLYAVLDGIDARMHNASATMLPALRQALNGFTRRADIIMRQLNYAGGGVQNHLLKSMERFRELNGEEQNEALGKAGEALATLSVEVADPDSIKLFSPRKAREINNELEENEEHGLDVRRQMFVQSAVDLAFTFNSQKQRDYVVQALENGRQIHSHELPIEDARDLLMSAHIVEVGSIGTHEFAFRVSPTQQRVKTEYFEATDQFTVELITRNAHAN